MTTNRRAAPDRPDHAAQRGPDEAVLADLTTERVFAVYFVAQAIVGVLVWVALFGSDAVRRAVELLPGHNEVMDSFVFADIILIVTASVLSAYGLVNEKHWTVPLTGFLAGCLVYPTFFLFGWLAFTGVGGVSLAIMIPPSMISTWIAWQTYRLYAVAHR